MPSSPAWGTRRSFLGAASSGLLASVASTAVQASEAEDAGPTPVRAALIGSGARGSDLLRSLTTLPRVDVVAVADDYAPHLERGLKYAGPQAKGYADFRALLEKERPQAVVVAVPLFEHFRVAEAALEAGCSVFCEKTMCFTMEQAEKLRKLVKDKRAIFQVGLQRRANPIYQQAAAMVKAGLIGQITAVKAQWHRNNNWRRPIPLSPRDAGWKELEERLNWRLYKSRSAGLMAELGSHQMDVVNWALGVSPKRVLATGGIDYWRDGREIEDNVTCIYEYELPMRERPVHAPGATAASAPNWAAAPKSDGGADVEKPGTYTVRAVYTSICNNAYEGASELIEGTKGTLFLASTKGLFYRERLPDQPAWSRSGDPKNAELLTAGKSLKISNSPWAHRGEPLEIDLLQADDTRDELSSFIDHVRRSDAKTICDVDVGWEDTATVLTAVESMRKGSWVDFPAPPHG